jgi:hypothetical protein
MLPPVTSRARIVVCEDGTEYVERFRRFLGEAFDFTPAGDFGAALAACAGADGILLDLDFRRTPPERLVDEAGVTSPALDAGTRRRLAQSQGILVLRALRARGVTLPAILFADLDDAQQARFLETSLAPLVVAPSSTGLREIAAQIRSWPPTGDPSR